MSAGKERRKWSAARKEKRKRSYDGQFSYIDTNHHSINSLIINLRQTGPRRYHLSQSGGESLSPPPPPPQLCWLPRVCFLISSNFDNFDNFNQSFTTTPIQIPTGTTSGHPWTSKKGQEGTLRYIQHGQHVKHVQHGHHG